MSEPTTNARTEGGEGGERYGIKETADLVVFIAVATSAAFAAGKDGFGLSDLGVAFSLMGEAKEAFQGIDKIPEEVKDLNAAELKELVQLVAEKLVLPESKATNLVPFALAMAPQIFGIIKCLTDPDEVDVALDSETARRLQEKQASN